MVTIHIFRQHVVVLRRAEPGNRGLSLVQTFHSHVNSVWVQWKLTFTPQIQRSFRLLVNSVYFWQAVTEIFYKQWRRHPLSLPHWDLFSLLGKFEPGVCDDIGVSEFEHWQTRCNILYLERHKCDDNTVMEKRDKTASHVCPVTEKYPVALVSVIKTKIKKYMKSK